MHLEEFKAKSNFTLKKLLPDSFKMLGFGPEGEIPPCHFAGAPRHRSAVTFSLAAQHCPCLRHDTGVN